MLVTRLTSHAPMGALNVLHAVSFVRSLSWQSVEQKTKSRLVSAETSHCPMGTLVVGAPAQKLFAAARSASVVVNTMLLTGDEGGESGGDGNCDGDGCGGGGGGIGGRSGHGGGSEGGDGGTSRSSCQ